jgi:hypothetical protein
MNVIIKWVAFMLHIQEVSGSTVHLETGFPEWGLS